MDPAEVLAVEIKQYVGGTLRTLVPRVIGQRAEAQQKKSSTTRGSRQWDEASFFEELTAQAPAAVEPARAIYEWATNHALRIIWGKGKQYGTFTAVLDHQGIEHKPIQVWTGDYFYVWFSNLKNGPPFEDESKRLELLYRLNDIVDDTIPATAINKSPSIPLTTLSNDNALERFLGVLDWIVEEIRTTT